MTLPPGSVTRLENLLHFGQLIKACGNNYFAKMPTFWALFVKASKTFTFQVKTFLGNFYRYLCNFLLVTLLPGRNKATIARSDFVLLSVNIFWFEAVVAIQ